jgi:hypothetical protein
LTVKSRRVLPLLDARDDSECKIGAESWCEYEQKHTDAGDSGGNLERHHLKISSDCVEEVGAASFPGDFVDGPK